MFSALAIEVTSPTFASYLAMVDQPSSYGRYSSTVLESRLIFSDEIVSYSLYDRNTASILFKAELLVGTQRYCAIKIGRASIVLKTSPFAHICRSMHLALPASACSGSIGICPVCKSSRSVSFWFTMSDRKNSGLPRTPNCIIRLSNAFLRTQSDNLSCPLLKIVFPFQKF